MPLRPREINDALSKDAIESLIRKAVKREIRRLNSTIAVLDHGGLTGLGDDDHALYMLEVGSPVVDETMLVWDGTTGRLTKSVGSLAILGAAGVDVTLRTADQPAGISGDLLIATGGGSTTAGDILIQPGVKTAAGNQVGSDVQLVGGTGGGDADGGLTIIRGGTGVSTSDGGEVTIDGGSVLGSGSIGDVVIQTGFTISPGGGFTTIQQIEASGGIDTSIITGTEVSVGVSFDGDGEPIAAGAVAEIRMEQGMTITHWFLLSEETGSIQIDVWVDSYANYPPTDADTITAGNEPSITASNKNTDSTLTGWTTTVADGDIIKFHVDSASSIKRATLILTGTRT